MPNTYDAPTGLAGGTVGATVQLSWNPAVQDPNPTAIILHMDGTNGSTSFPDSGPNGIAVTANGTAAVDTSNTVFGTGSLLMSALTDSITAPCTAAGPLDISAGDFTIEFWYYPGQTTFSLAEELFEIGMGSSFASNGLMIYCSGNGTPSPPTTEILNTVGGFAATGVAAGNINAGVWSHIFLGRKGVRFFFGCNGTAQCINPGGGGFSGPIGWGGGSLKLGQGLWTHTFVGSRFDELRVSTTSLYDSATLGAPYSYTIPTAPFVGTGTPAPGYDVYRNGVSIASFLGSYAYTDTPPGYGTYTYNVAAWSGSADISPQSANLSYAFGPGTFYLQPKFVPAVDFKAIMVANPGYINPRVYEPAVDTTVRIKQ